MRVILTSFFSFVPSLGMISLSPIVGIEFLDSSFFNHEWTISSLHTGILMLCFGMWNLALFETMFGIWNPESWIVQLVGPL